MDEDVEMVWMRHGDGVPAAFPVGAQAAWQAMGWAPCDAPKITDPAMVEHQPIPTKVPAEPALTKKRS